MSDYQGRADAAERELADMERRAERLGEHVDEVRDDWDAKVQDPDVPGAGGDPGRAAEGGRHPETAVIAKGPEDEATTPDPTDNDRGADDTPGGGDDAQDAERERPGGERGGNAGGRIPGDLGGGDD